MYSCSTLEPGGSLIRNTRSKSEGGIEPQSEIRVWLSKEDAEEPKTLLIYFCPLMCI